MTQHDRDDEITVKKRVALQCTALPFEASKKSHVRAPDNCVSQSLRAIPLKPLCGTKCASQPATFLSFAT